MFMSRTIGAAIRGGQTPLQMFLTCVVGGMIGFMPPFMQAPALVILLIILLAILNTNFFIVGIVALLTKLVSLFTMPIVFEIGRFLIDGPTSGLFKVLINGPVTALMGLEYYAITGGMVFGAVVGLVIGFIFVKLLNAFWAGMSKLEDKDMYQKFTSNKPMKFMSWVLLGGGPKEGYSKLKEKRIGNPIRVLGVVFSVLLVGLVVILYQFFSEPIIMASLKSGLEEANGASVDIRKAEVNLKENRMVIEGLAMTDPNDLHRDLLRAEKIEADISGADLLRKRFRLDQVVVTDATQGAKRSSPGYHIGNRETSTTRTDEPAEDGEKTIDDYIADAKEWKQKLEQAREWLEKISGPEEEGEQQGQPDIADEESFEEWLDREIALRGYGNVRAIHHIEGAPTLLISKLQVNRMKTEVLTDETIDLEGENLSTHPHLVADPPRIRVKSSGDSILANAMIGGSAGGTRASKLDFKWVGLKVDEVLPKLLGFDEPVFKGGTIDISTKGLFDPSGKGRIEFPFETVFRDTTINLPQLGETLIEQLALPLGVEGPVANPRIKFNEDDLVRALTDAGKSELAAKLQGEADKYVKKATSEVTKLVNKEIGEAATKLLGENAAETLNSQLGENLGKEANNLIGGLLGQKPKPTEPTNGEQQPTQQPTQDLGEQAGKAATELIGGFLNSNKKSDEPEKKDDSQKKVEDAARDLLGGFLGGKK